MLKSRVSCHFCSKETQVFMIYKNSWECQECKQYNGFNKDGDYNKQIPEMQNENKKTFCLNNTPATPKKTTESKNLLCERCNYSQEQKVKEMNNFEAKNDNNFDEEYKIYKQKLDHIYDLCRNCKTKLNQHLSRQDHQIGFYLSNDKGLKSTPLKAAMKQSKLKISTETLSDFRLRKRQVQMDLPTNSEVPNVNDHQMGYTKKAYTVSGSAPYSHEHKNLVNRISPSKAAKYIFESDMVEPDRSMGGSGGGSSDTDYTSKVDKLLSTNLVKSKHSISWFVIQTVMVDILSFLGILLIFSCDIVNLINDSGIWQDIDYNNPDEQQQQFANDQHYLFRTFLKVYKYSQILLVLILSVSIYFAVKRPKMSRFLTCIGILFNLLIHVNFFSMNSDEKFILEVFISFFLSCYLSLARVYNVLQCYRYVKNASSNSSQ